MTQTTEQANTLRCLRASQPDKGFATFSRRTGNVYAQWATGTVIIYPDGRAEDILSAPNPDTYATH